VNIGEHLELIRAAHIVAIAGHAVGNHFFAILVGTNLAGLEGLDHAFFGGHTGNPAIRFNRHYCASMFRGNWRSSGQW
jgi:hypothetical protein